MGTSRLLPWISLGGAVLAASSMLPMTPEGESFVRLLLRAFAHDPMQGVATLLGFGSPFLFGLAAVVVPWVRAPELARGVIRLPLSLMHAHLFLVSLVLVWHGRGVASLPLLGFAAVSGGYFVFHSARARAEGSGPDMFWSIRWGAMMVAAITAWARLQWVGGIRLGVAIDVALLAALVLAWVSTQGGSDAGQEVD